MKYILTQYYPLSKELGKYQYENSADKKDINTFYEVVNTTDHEHKSIILQFENPDSAEYTEEELRAMCIQKFSQMYGNPELKNFYFIFGSDPVFPYCGRYLIVKAKSWTEARKKYREKYPDLHKNCLNCAFFYTQSQWDEIRCNMGICHEIID